MSNDRHFTTRRGFVGAMGFGALGLYATWAAYGAAPTPFGAAAPADPHAGHGAAPTAGGHAGHGEPAIAAPHGGGSGLTATEFEARHAEFLKRFRRADGSVWPTAAGAPAAPTGHDHAAMAMAGDAHSGHDMPAADPHAGHGAAMPAADPHAGHGAAMPSADPHAGHGAAMPAADPHAAHAAPAADAGHAGHDGHGGGETPAAAMPVAAGHDHDGGDEPVEIYLAAGRFAFEPDDLRLEVGRRYRFHMMATDVAHGASIAFGSASRIVRLRPETVTTLDLTFRAAGRHLVYCTVYCGPGHDGMHAAITVA